MLVKFRTFFGNPIQRTLPLVGKNASEALTIISDFLAVFRNDYNFIAASSTKDSEYEFKWEEYQDCDLSDFIESKERKMNLESNSLSRMIKRDENRMIFSSLIAPKLPKNFSDMQYKRANTLPELHIKGVCISRRAFIYNEFASKIERIEYRVSHPKNDFTLVHAVADMAIACGWTYTDCIEMYGYSFLIFTK